MVPTWGAKMRELTDSDRLKLIEKAFLDCEQEFTQEDLRSQFRYETGREPDERVGDRGVQAGQEGRSFPEISA
jgi:hypothetical protein